MLIFYFDLFFYFFYKSRKNTGVWKQQVKIGKLGDKKKRKRMSERRNSACLQSTKEKMDGVRGAEQIAVMVLYRDRLI